MLRLLADDLTGALDSTAPFAAGRAPIPVFWTEPPTVPRTCALDSETRDLPPGSAAARVAALAPLLQGAEVAFKKIDSRLRGHPALEIAACARAGGFRSTVIAPAFPDQGRISRGGRQLVRTAEGAWQPVEPDLAPALAAAGLPVRAGDPAGEGAFLCDAESEEDLQRIVAAGRRLAPPVLWCGTGGLARALAGDAPRAISGMSLRPPVLVLAGSGHPATGRQLARLRPGPRLRVRALAHDGFTSAAQAQAALLALVTEVAAGEPPGTLVATGGETLLRFCEALGAARLDVLGELAPGVPLSRLVGGPWDGVPVISKSGGFGGPGLLADLIGGIAHA